MAYNDLPTAKEIETSSDPTQSSKSPAEVIAKFIVYLIAGIVVGVIIILVYIFG